MMREFLKVTLFITVVMLNTQTQAEEIYIYENSHTGNALLIKKSYKNTQSSDTNTDRVDKKSTAVYSNNSPNLLVRFANQGDAESQYNLGNVYFYGRGVVQSYEKAVEWYTKSARQGFTKAQYNLGNMYLNGQGIMQSYDKAVKWYTHSAHQGLAEAQYNLGNMYLNGQGVIQSYDKAIKWYTQSADQGLAEAQYNLGNMHLSGEGITKSYKKAKELYRKSCKNANEAGCKKYAVLNSSNH